MNKLILIGCIVVSTFLVGCASSSDLAEVREMAINAQKSADNAQATASNASKCCEQNRQEITRMYQK